MCSHSHLSPWFHITTNVISGFVYRAFSECQALSQQLGVETWRSRSVSLERILWLQTAETQVAFALEKGCIGSYKQSMRRAVPGVTTASACFLSSPFMPDFFARNGSPHRAGDIAASSHQTHSLSLNIGGDCPSGVRHHLHHSLCQVGRICKKMAAPVSTTWSELEE